MMHASPGHHAHDHPDNHAHWAEQGCGNCAVILLVLASQEQAA
jgi:hypothetical protein